MDESVAKNFPVPEPLVVIEQEEEPKAQLASKNGKKSEGAGGSSFFTWFMVLALLGVWTSVAVVYFDLVDYQGAIGLTKDDSQESSDSSEEIPDVLAEEGSDWFQGFFTFLYGLINPFEPFEDEEGAAAEEEEEESAGTSQTEGVQGKNNLVRPESPKTTIKREPPSTKTEDGKPEHVAKKETKKENHLTKDVGWKLKEALKQQLAMIHERVEAKKIAKMALAEVRNILAKEEVQVFKSKDMAKKAKVAVASRLKVEEKMIEKEKKEKEEKDKKVFEKIRQTKQQKEDEEERRKAKEKKPGRNLEVASKKADEPKGAKSKGATKASAQKQKVSDKRNRK
uniref:Aspartyl beta-hydroxylase/Triadin domain-containing protein n=1 Tax=Esox lucius TaxID=8010 RepID=A0A3P9APN6_ESOLU